MSVEQDMAQVRSDLKALRSDHEALQRYVHGQLTDAWKKTQASIEAIEKRLKNAPTHADMERMSAAMELQAKNFRVALQSIPPWLAVGGVSFVGLLILAMVVTLFARVPGG